MSGGASKISYTTFGAYRLDVKKSSPEGNLANTSHGLSDVSRSERNNDAKSLSLKRSL